MSFILMDLFIFYSVPTLEYQEKKDKLKMDFCLLSVL